MDWSQNNGNKTTIAPYSLRGRAHPTVAAPARGTSSTTPTSRTSTRTRSWSASPGSATRSPR
ncbi:hypothetical protein NKG05_24650 [Oerskovia sp. M15]